MDVDGANPTRLDAPVGYITSLKPCRPGLILNIVADDRVGDISVIDTASWKVQRVTSMK